MTKDRMDEVYARTWQHSPESRKQLTSGVHIEARLSVQRQARRAHRKRIAQITCEKWKGFSENRLRAYRHHRRKLLIAGLWAFCSQAQQSSRSHRNALVLRSRIQYRQLSQAIQAWATAARRLRYLTRVVTDFSSNRTASILVAALQWWHTYMLQKHHKQRLACKAAYFHTFIITSNAMQAWRTHVLRRRQKSRQHSQAVAHAHRKALQHTVVAWQQFKIHSQQKARALRAADAHHMRKAQCAYLRAWRRAAQHSSQARCIWLAKLHAVEHERNAATLNAALHAWWAYAQESVRRRVAAAALAVQRLHTQVSAVMSAWAAGAAQRSRLNHAHTAVCALRPRLELRHAMLQWQAGSEAAGCERHAALRTVHFLIFSYFFDLLADLLSKLHVLFLL